MEEKKDRTEFNLQTLRLRNHSTKEHLSQMRCSSLVFFYLSLGI